MTSKYSLKDYSQAGPIEAFKYMERQKESLQQLYNTFLNGKVKIVKDVLAYSNNSIKHLNEDRFLYDIAEAFREMRNSISNYRERISETSDKTLLQTRINNTMSSINTALDTWKPTVRWDVQLGDPNELPKPTYRGQTIKLNFRAGYVQKVYQQKLSIVSGKFIMDINNIQDNSDFEGAKIAEALVLDISNIKEYNSKPQLTIEPMHLSWLKIEDRPDGKTSIPYTGLGKTAKTSRTALKRVVIGAVKREML